MDNQLELVAQPHPDPKIRRVGFDLAHPYVEQCWGALLGPSGVTILRRLPILWEHEEPARLPATELARSLGLGSATSGGGRFARALDRLEDFRVAHWIDPDRSIAVYTQLPPLTDRQLDRLPAWTHRAHHELLNVHLNELAAPQTRLSLTDRLERLQHSTSSTPARGLGL